MAVAVPWIVYRRSSGHHVLWVNMDDPVWFLNRDKGTEGLVVKGEVEEGQYTFIIFSA